MDNTLQSENIAELASALAKAQGEIESAVFDKVNPHFKSKYASYGSYREACRLPLATNGLAVTHLLTFQEGKRMMVTQLSHTSGQWMRSFLVMPQDKETPQGIGSSIAYCKRYALGSLLAMGSDEDDDGEESEKPYRKEDYAPIPKLSFEQQEEIVSLCGDDNNLIERILKAYKCTSLADISAKAFCHIINTIKFNKEKEKANEEVSA